MFPLVSMFAVVGVPATVSLNQSWQNNQLWGSKFSFKVSKYEPNTSTTKFTQTHSHVSIPTLTKVTKRGQVVSIWAECRLSGVRAFNNTHINISNGPQIIQTVLFSVTNKASGDCVTVGKGLMWRWDVKGSLDRNVWVHTAHAYGKNVQHIHMVFTLCEETPECFMVADTITRYLCQTTINHLWQTTTKWRTDSDNGTRTWWERKHTQFKEGQRFTAKKSCNVSQTLSSEGGGLQEEVFNFLVERQNTHTALFSFALSILC